MLANFWVSKHERFDVEPAVASPGVGRSGRMEWDQVDGTLQRTGSQGIKAACAGRRASIKVPGETRRSVSGVLHRPAPGQKRQNLQVPHDLPGPTQPRGALQGNKSAQGDGRDPLECSTVVFSPPDSTVPGDEEELSRHPGDSLVSAKAFFVRRVHPKPR